jgi:signal transduction histidine kinase
VVWLGTTGMGLLRFNPERKELILYQRDADAPITLTNNFILAIHPDPSDSTILWLGTDGGGLNRFDTDIGSVTHHFTTAEGLPNNVIYGILSDHRGRLWMSSNNGLFVFDPAAMKLLDRYDVNDGLQSNEFNRYQFWKDEQGRLYFGGINGWNSFDPDEIQPRQYVPPIVLTDLRIFNVSLVYPHIRPPLQTSLQRTNRVVLESNQNMLTIEFASLDYAAPRKVRYKYLLEGLDEHWVEVSSTDGEGQNRTEAKRTATYTNLEPGEYLFRVKGTNSDGVWNETERTLSIVIVPPFWKTTWFRASAVLFVFVLVAASVRYFELRKIRERTRQLEQEAAIERERLRISKDMHDDLGSRLTHIELLSNLTARNMKDRQSVERNLQDISAAADELVTAFDEIVWAVNPHYDTVEGLMDYLAQFVSSYLDRSGIESHVDLPAAPAQVAISAESRHNIFMMVKEALNNSVKYAQAKDVWLQFDCTGSQLTVTVKDNGVGFDVTAVKKFSEGLANMKKRMEDIGGTCTVESAPGKGTTVTAVVPLTSSKNHPNG